MTGATVSLLLKFLAIALAGVAAYWWWRSSESQMPKDIMETGLSAEGKNKDVFGYIREQSKLSGTAAAWTAGAVFVQAFAMGVDLAL